jgi:hypothetical protein
MRKPVTLGIVGISCLFALLAADQTALAQAGSTGGTLGKTDKSASGGEQQAAAATAKEGMPKTIQLNDHSGWGTFSVALRHLRGSAEVAHKGMVDGRHHLIVTGFDLAKIRSYLTGYAGTCSAKTWHEAAMKLSRLGHWEFEDYRL